MVTEVIMPKLGQTMEEGKVERWLKKEGDRVERGDILLEITTDKATLEVESYGRGILRKIIVKEGETVPVTQIIALIAEPDEELPEIEVPSKKEEVRPEEKVPETKIKASPLAKRIAQEKGIDLSQIVGTGPGGRITKEDILKAAEAQVKPGEKIEPLTSMRKAIAEAMVMSKSKAPHYYLTIEVDMSEAVKLREKLIPKIEKEAGVKLSFSHLLIKAVASSLREFLQINSTWTDTGIRRFDEINIGIAVGLEEGLIVPVLRNADKLNLSDIARNSDDLVARAKERKLKADEYSGGTFTISNLGMFGVENFIPVINPPESGILGVGAIMKKPAVVNGKVEVRAIMKLTLSADHRVVDGTVAAQFLQRIKELLEKPEGLIGRHPPKADRP